MKLLSNFPIVQQKTENSSWAAVCRMIINYYTQKKTFKSDEELAYAYYQVSGELSDLNLEQMQSAPDVLRLLGYKNELSENHFPDRKKIKKMLKKGIPLLAKVSTKQPTSRHNNHESDHWIVIIGIKGNQLIVADPKQTTTIQVEFNFKTYKPTNYAEVNYWVKTAPVFAKNTPTKHES